MEGGVQNLAERGICCWISADIPLRRRRQGHVPSGARSREARSAGSACAGRAHLGERDVASSAFTTSTTIATRKSSVGG
jgi:hypothetical protein